MKVLSWDVGLRTLSYCLLENTRVPTDKYGNTSGDNDTRTVTLDSVTPDPDADAGLLLRATPSVTDATDDTFCFNILHWDSIDVQVDADTQPNMTISAATGVIKPSKREKVTAVSIEEGARLIIDTLHRRADFLANGVDAIIIEQQPAGGHNQQANVRMKVMSHAIQCYFYTRGIMSHIFVAPTITFVPANSKFEEKPKIKRLTVKNATGQIPLSDTAAATDSSGVSSAPVDAIAPPVNSHYSVNKKFAVIKAGELVRAFLPGRHPARLLFDATSTKKKDDLADSFLLGYYFLKKKHTALLVANAKAHKAAQKKTKVAATGPKRKSRAAPKAGPADAETSGPADAGTSGPADAGTSGPADAGTSGPADAGTSGPADAGTSGPADAGTSGPADAGTSGPADAGTSGPADAVDVPDLLVPHSTKTRRKLKMEPSIDEETATLASETVKTKRLLARSRARPVKPRAETSSDPLQTGSPVPLCASDTVPALTTTHLKPTRKRDLDETGAPTHNCGSSTSLDGDALTGTSTTESATHADINGQKHASSTARLSVTATKPPLKRKKSNRSQIVVI
jgi:hypothetical protein